MVGEGEVKSSSDSRLVEIGQATHGYIWIIRDINREAESFEGLFIAPFSRSRK